VAIKIPMLDTANGTKYVTPALTQRTVVACPSMTHVQLVDGEEDVATTNAVRVVFFR
jgi:hypothetical protein